jgi:hypothetical protein
MQFANESELQSFISSALHQLGHENMREVFTESGKGRIDILSAKYAIEVKPKLTRSSLFQAAGQVQSYMSSFPGRRLVIAGISPTGDDAYRSAKSTAQVIEQENGIAVWFVDEMPQFQELYLGNPQQATVESQEQQQYYDEPDYFYFDFDSVLGKCIAAVVIIFVIAATMTATKNGTPTAVTAIDQSRGKVTALQAALVTGRFNLRSDPTTSTDANIVGTVNPGDVVGLTGRSTDNQYGNWLEIQTDNGTRAWVAASALE